MKQPRPATSFLTAATCAVLWCGAANLHAQPPAVTLATDGKALLNIYFANPPIPAVPEKKKAKQNTRPLDQAVADLRRVLKQMTGAECFA